jgi:hypothetical protein
VTVEEARRVLERYIGPVYGGKLYVSGTPFLLTPFLLLDAGSPRFSLTPSQCYDVADALMTLASALEQGRRVGPAEDE